MSLTKVKGSVVSADGISYTPEAPGTPTDVQSALRQVETLTLPTGGTTGQVLTKDSAADGDASWQNSVGGSSGIQVLKTNNLVRDSAFRFGGKTEWAEQTTDLARSQPTVDETANFLTRAFDYAKWQLSIDGPGEVARMCNSRLIPINLDEGYMVKYWANAAGGSANLQTQIFQFDYDGNVSGSISDTKLISTGVSSTSEYAMYINPFGMGGVAWSADITSVRLKFESQAAAGGNHNIYHAFFSKEPQSPIPASFGAKTSNGGGLHEAVYDGTEVIYVAHGYDKIGKFNPATFERGITASVGSYPHDICIVGTDVWIITGGGTGSTKNIEQYAIATLAAGASAAITGGRAGFAITPDDVDPNVLWIGAGITAETPAIIKYEIATNAQTVISTDVDGGSANLPVEILGGDLWSVDTGSVKRITKAGVTVATIPVGFKIYGLGTDGTYVYANYDSGVVRIDPATNTIVNTWLFEIGMYGGTKLKHINGKVWGCTQAPSSHFYIDLATDELVSGYVFSGSPKFVVDCGVGNGVLTGAFYTPELALLAQ